MGRLVGWCVGGGGGRQKVEETRVGVTRHREHVVVALAVDDGSHVHTESIQVLVLPLWGSALLRLLSKDNAAKQAINEKLQRDVDSWNLLRAGSYYS